MTPTLSLDALQERASSRSASTPLTAKPAGVDGGWVSWSRRQPGRSCRSGLWWCEGGVVDADLVDQTRKVLAVDAVAADLSTGSSKS